jgi:non-ribosomal peptide synthase protein (TIGR01720 family)
VNDLQRKLAALSPRQRDALMAKLGLASAPATPASAASAAPASAQEAPQEPGPLSPAQQRMWLFEKIEGSASAYNIASVLRVRGALDVDALQHAINALVRRHEVLRTTFEEVDGEPRARIASEAGITVERAAFDADPAQDFDDRLRRAIDAHVAVEFDLARGPLLRVATVALGADEHLIIAVIHHILADGWSLRLIERELSQAYADALAARSAPAAAAPVQAATVQYRDYVAWQRDWLRSAGPRQLAYWTAALDGAPACWPMPTLQPREAARDLSADSAILSLSAALCARVHALAQAEQASAFMVLAAAFKVVLARLSGSDDLSFGTPVANRREARFDPVVGLFSNTVVLRSQVRPGPFRDYLQQVRRAALDAFSHQDLPFEQVVDALRPERSAAHPPLFQVLFALQSTDSSELVLPGLSVRPVHLPRRASEFDLIFEFFLGPDDNHAVLTWRTALYPAAMIRRLQTAFVEVLERVVADPDVRIDALQAGLAAAPAVAPAQDAAAFLSEYLPLEADDRVLSSATLAEDTLRALAGWAHAAGAASAQAQIDPDALRRHAPTMLALAPHEWRQVQISAMRDPGLLEGCRGVLLHGDDPARPAAVAGPALWQCWGIPASDGPCLLRRVDADSDIVRHRGAFACVNAQGEALPSEATGELRLIIDDVAHATGLRGRLTAAGLCVDGFVARHGWVEGCMLDTDAIEDALQRLPGVAAAAVVPRQDRDGVWRLVGHVVPAHRLPPRAFESLVREHGGVLAPLVRTVCVSRLPRLRDGRLDLEALAALPVLDADTLDTVARALDCAPAQLEPVWSEPPAPPPLAIVRPVPRAQTVATTAADGTPALAVGEALRTPHAAFSLVDVLRRAAQAHGEHGITYLDDASGEGPTQRYVDLLDAAARALAGLRAAGLRPGQRVLLQFASNRQLLTAFWACVLGGAQPIPVALPKTADAQDKDLTKITNAWPALDVAWVLTSRDHDAETARLAQALGLSALPALAIEALLEHAPAGDWHSPDPDDVALLLLTSGSTGLPKAVRQSHRALVSRSAATAQRFGFDHRMVSLNWMPLDHVGGLVMYHLLDVYLGARQFHCATQVVLEQPLRWIEWMSRYRVTNTWAPNFAYAVVNELLAQAGPQDWDLRELDFILNGGESIVPRTARAFLRALAPYGLRPNAMKPAWGMSETCSGVTFNDRFDLDNSADEDSFVVVGAPIPGVSIRIVDAHDRPVAEGCDGRLQLSGPSVTSGYHNNPEATRDAFTTDGWYITGDLAVLRDGQLTITGREKDLIIVNGLNYYGHEIEQVVESVPDVLEAHVAACGVRRRGDNTDRLAVFYCAHERARDNESLRARIARAVLARIGIPVSYLIEMTAEELPRTSIGKIQRPQLAQRFNQGEFDARLAARDGDGLPAWFFEPTWRPLPATGRAVRETGVVLIAGDGAEIAELAAELAARFARAVVVRRGASLRREGEDAFVADTHRPEQLAQVLRTLQQEDARHWRLVLQVAGGGQAGLDALHARWTDVQTQTLSALLAVTQAVIEASDHVAAHFAALDVISERAFALRPGESSDPALGALPGLLRSIAQELPALRCRQIDLDSRTPAMAARAAAEIAALSEHDTVALRDGRRHVRGLRVATTATPTPSVLEDDGLCVVTGGLGGIGQALCEWLLRHSGQHLLVLGRSAPDADPERQPAHARLRATWGARFAYAVQDVCDLEGLQRLLRTHEQTLGLPLRRVWHLAGSLHERTLAEETPAGLLQALHAKGLGALVLHVSLRARPEVEIVHFGSVNGFFGGVGVAGYAAANSLLDALTAHRRAEGGACRCVHWSMWDEIGMSRGYGRQALVAARGYALLDRERGLDSLLPALAAAGGTALVGLEPGNPNTARHLDGAPIGYWRLRPDAAHAAAPPELRDAFGARLAWASDAGAATSATAADAGAMSPLEQQLAAIWQDVLRTPTVGPQANFFELGGDSIMAIQVVARANKAGIAIAPRAVFECQTLRELAQSAGEAGADDADAPLRLGEVPLGPVQRWFFDQTLEDPAHMNQSALLRLRERVEPALLGQALAALTRQHEQLRARFPGDGDALRQVLIEDTEVPLDVVALEDADPADRARALAAHCDRLQAGLDLARGPLVRAGYFLGPDAGDDRLLLVVHHLVIDGVSWRILLDDLENALEQLQRGQAPRLGRRGCAYGEWAAQAVRAAQQLDPATIEHWQRTCAEPTALPAPDRDVPDLRGDETSLEVSLAPQVAQALLQRLPSAWNLGINDLLLAALHQAWQQWSGSPRLLLTLEGHGRGAAAAELDLSRTVGWFTAIYPVALDCDAAAPLQTRARRMQTCLAQVPGEGASWLALRHGGDPAARAALAGCHVPRISFNYLGRFDVDDGRLLAFAGESPGAQISPRQQRLHEIDVVGAVVEDTLRFSFVFSGARYARERIQPFAQAFADALHALAHEAEAPGTRLGSGVDADALRAALRGRGIAPERVEAALRTTPTQTGLIYESEVSGVEGTYVSQLVNELVGPLDTAALRQAWQDVVQRHGVYRSAFLPSRQGHYLQVVLDAVALPWTALDWSDLPVEVQERRFEDLLAQDGARSFVLARAPALRLHLIRMAPDRHRMLISEHHCVSDGWSRGLVLAEVAALYRQHALGRDAALPVPVSFERHVAWLERFDRAAAGRYWREHLHGASPMPAYAGQRTASDDRRAPGTARSSVRLPAAATAALVQAARARRVMLGALVQAAWALTMAAWTGRSDVNFLTTHAGRPPALEGVERIVGPMICTVPVRVDLGAQGSLLDAARRFQSLQADRNEQGYLPLAEACAGFAPDATRAKFDTLFVFENFPLTVPEAKPGELQVAWVRSLDRSDLPLSIMAVPGEALEVVFYYRDDLFDEATIDAIAASFLRVLTLAAQQPEASPDPAVWLDADTRSHIARGLAEREAQAAMRVERSEPASTCTTF